MVVANVKRYRMFVTKAAKTVANISKLSPTYFFSNIRHQYRGDRRLSSLDRIWAKMQNRTNRGYSQCFQRVRAKTVLKKYHHGAWDVWDVKNITMWKNITMYEMYEMRVSHAKLWLEHYDKQLFNAPRSKLNPDSFLDDYLAASNVVSYFYDRYLLWSTLIIPT